jgi:hypothetical protein
VTGFYNRDGVCLPCGTSCPQSVFICFTVDLRSYSDYFTVWHKVTAFITEPECVYCAVLSTHTVYVFINEAVCLLRGTFYRNNVFMGHYFTVKHYYGLYNRGGVFTARFVLPKQCINVFCMDLRTN